MTITYADPDLTVEARGTLAYLIAANLTTFTIEDMRAAGVSRDTAYRVRDELKARNLARKASSSAWELINFSGFTYFRNYGNPEFQQHSYIESREHDHDAVGSIDFSGIPENRKPEAEPTQQTLDGLPEAPNPVPPPPSPGKPVRERKPPAPPEIKALYPPLFALTKSPPKGRKAMGCYTVARNLHRDFGATPEQLLDFWDWFKTFSQAATIAARERRPLNAPMPAQVYEAWPQYKPWWDARQAQAARDAERRAVEEAAAPPPPSDAPRLSGRELYRRTFSLPRPDTPVLTAAD